MLAEHPLSYAGLVLFLLTVAALVLLTWYRPALDWLTWWIPYVRRQLAERRKRAEFEREQSERIRLEKLDPEAESTMRYREEFELQHQVQPSTSTAAPTPSPTIGKIRSPLDVGLVMRIVVTLAVLGSALFIVLSTKQSPEQQKWAFGAIGTILGYWLKG